VIVTGMEKVAPWQPLEDDVLMEAAPGRSMRSLPGLTVILGLDGAMKLTPVVVHIPIPPDAVIVPFGATEVRVTE
jgi:hypothetical protein